MALSRDTLREQSRLEGGATVIADIWEESRISSNVSCFLGSFSPGEMATWTIESVDRSVELPRIVIDYQW